MRSIITPEQASSLARVTAYPIEGSRDMGIDVERWRLSDSQESYEAEARIIQTQGFGRAARVGEGDGQHGPITSWRVSDVFPKPVVKLEQWAVLLRGDWYTAPELRSPRLHGQVYGHPGFPEGQEITTSTVLGKTPFDLVETRNTLYELGTPSPQYEEMFPGARGRLLESLYTLHEVKYP